MIITKDLDIIAIAKRMVIANFIGERMNLGSFVVAIASFK